MKEILIIGSGPAGWTAAIYAARAGYTVKVVTGLQPGGQLTTTTDIENWPGGEEGLQAPLLMEQMQAHAVRYGVEIINDVIVGISVLGHQAYVVYGEDDTYHGNAIILATGSSAKYLGLPSEEKFKGRGVSACATCDGFFYRNKNVVVVGGGNTAVEEALYLSNIASEVYLIHRGPKLRAEKILQDRLLKRANITLIFDTEIKEILGDGLGVTGVNTYNKILNEEFGISDIQGVFIAIGHKPNTDFVKGLVTLDEAGYVEVGVVSEYPTGTDIPGIFAAGDVSDPVYRQAITSSGDGCRAALDAINYLETCT